MKKLSNKITLLIVITALMLLSIKANAQRKDSLEIVNAASTFLKAFNEFNWQKFRSSFTKDATIFFPEWEIGKRVTGKKDIEATWLEIFPEFMDSANKERMNITPQNLHIQIMSKVAIVTFHLGGKEIIGRRTLVFVKQKQQWKIAHLHASFLENN